MRKPRIGGAVYVLPNLLTTGNLFFGFFCIMTSLQGRFGWAGAAILLAAVFDMLDGRVARLTKGTSEFGVQYDSLCDLVSFGCAPAILMYQFGLSTYGRIGWVLCFLFLACGALRLARFNVMSGIGKASGDFTGLPIPMAAAVVATFVLFMTELDAAAQQGVLLQRTLHRFFDGLPIREVFLLAAAPLLSILMVSNIIYRSHKVLKVGTIKPFKLLTGMIFLIALIAYQPETIGFVLVLGYALSGIVEWALGWKKPTEEEEIFATQSEDDSIMEPAPSGHGDPNGDDERDPPVRNITGLGKENGKQ